MGPTIIARNYAETLYALAEKGDGMATVESYARAIAEIAEMLQSEPKLQHFLETPRVGLEEKKAAVRKALGGRSDDQFLRFLLIVLEKRRQSLLVEIAAEYRTLLDEAKGRVRATVTLSEEPDAALERGIVEALESRLGKSVLAEFQVDTTMLGGVVVRVGDEILDGSLRSRLGTVRRQMMRAEIQN